MSTVGKDIARSWVRSVIIRLISVAIGVPLLCGLIFVPLWLIDTYDLSPWLLLAPGALLMFLLLGGGAAAFALVIHRRKTRLDEAFVPLGLQGSFYQTFFRQYHGTVQDRQVDVWLYRGPVCEIEVSTTLQSRLGITGAHGDTRFLARLLSQQPLVLNDPALSDMTVFAHDEVWTRRLLENPHAVELLRRLVSTGGTFTCQQVIQRPGTFKLLLSGSLSWTVFEFQITPQQAQDWLDDLLRLANIAERLPPPQITDVESRTEQMARRWRSGQNLHLGLWVGLGTLLGIPLCGVLLTVIILMLDNLQ